MTSLTVRTTLVALLLAVSACSGSGDEQSAEPSDSASTSAPATTSAPSPTAKKPSVAPVDLPPCQSIVYDLSPNGPGARTPLVAIRDWGAREAKDVPPVPAAGWERLPADSKSTATMTNPTAPVWMVEVTRTSAGGWVVKRASWGVCH